MNQPSTFCPKECEPIIHLCIPCRHSDDREFKNPEAVEVRNGSGWVKTQIVGREGGTLYLADNTSVDVGSKMIR